MARSQREAFEPLSAADASNIAIDAPDQVNAFLMAGVLAPGGPASTDGTVDMAALRRLLSERLRAVPRMAQRVARRRSRLVWEPATLDLVRHVREVDPVEGLPGFERLCAALIVEPLATDHPLWEVLVAPGVAPSRSGIVVRIHHAMADGIAAVRLAQALLDPTPATSNREVMHPPQPGPALGNSPSRRAARAKLKTLVSAVQRTAAMFRTAVPRTSLLGPLGAIRTIAFADVELQPLAQGAASVGATLNDALLAAVGAGVRSALLDTGEDPPATLPVSVPVALPDRGGSGNAVGVMVVPLPTAEAATEVRLSEVAGLTRARKTDARSRGTLEITRMPLTARIFARFARHQRMVALFVTNVPGPRDSLSLGGAPLERIWPVTTLQGNVRVGVSALSYAGRLMCSIHGDAAGVDARRVAAGLQEEFARITGLAQAPKD
ncbi:wax ester/triacylglycerol synthase domain-containing protein [Ruicaihuangia caeni]|uniref:diacylglycerol O-acyltransferase n=1 Tax=Ruicaihuangia caeni TaxID=3042517 RepID=A0AAW6TCE9_9MICO|nr:wax ester/triacylglycerol synthase domain-containing protein [Klugiella sp. YN-L-19]MDI2099683.1 wax ester/triacylglycerol synthase family O-acyltransferase [Klugiella sp. YN-L-19]